MERSTGKPRDVLERPFAKESTETANENNWPDCREAFKQAEELTRAWINRSDAGAKGCRGGLLPLLASTQQKIKEPRLRLNIERQTLPNSPKRITLNPSLKKISRSMV